jgi:hypothetical protein
MFTVTAENLVVESLDIETEDNQIRTAAVPLPSRADRPRVGAAKISTNAYRHVLQADPGRAPSHA